MPLSFHFVALKDGATKPKLLSQKWNTSHVSRWINDLNGIFTTQANVAFAPKIVREAPVDSYQGASRVYKTGEEWTNEVGNERDKGGGAAANVFLVGKWRGMGDDQYKDVFAPSRVRGLAGIVRLLDRRNDVAPPAAVYHQHFSLSHSMIP